MTWNKALNTTALTNGAVFTMPAGVAQPNTSLIYTMVTLFLHAARRAKHLWDHSDYQQLLHAAALIGGRDLYRVLN